jgi:hypothetical protein
MSAPGRFHVRARRQAGQAGAIKARIMAQVQQGCLATRADAEPTQSPTF